jgi:hypothetical protein
MVADLGSRLVRAGLVTRSRLAEALAGGPLHEGELVHRLVDGGVDQDALVGFFLSLGYGPLLRAPDLVGVEPEVLARLPGGMARSLMALPIRRTAAGLVVAFAAPSDDHVVPEVQRAVGLPILPTVVRLEDLLAALDRLHPPPSRAPAPAPASETLATGPDRGRYGTSTRGADRAAARALLGPDTLLDEEVEEGVVPLVRTKGPRSHRRRVITQSFERPGASPAPSRHPASWGRARSSFPLSSNPPPVEDQGANIAEAVSAAARRVSSQPAPAHRVLSPLPPNPRIPSFDERPTDPGPGPSPQAPEQRAEARSIIPPGQDSWAARPPSLPANKVGAATRALFGRALPRRPPPVGGILSSLRRARSRDAVVDLACQGALTVARGAALLLLRGRMLHGYRGAGDIAPEIALRNLVVPRDASPTLHGVLTTRSPYRGPWGEEAADELLRAALRSRGGAIGVAAVAVGSRPVGLLTADGMRHGGAGLERLETVARAAGEALERLVLDRKHP